MKSLFVSIILIGSLQVQAQEVEIWNTDQLIEYIEKKHEYKMDELDKEVELFTLKKKLGNTKTLQQNI